MWLRQGQEGGHYGKGRSEMVMCNGRVVTDRDRGVERGGGYMRRLRTERKVRRED